MTFDPNSDNAMFSRILTELKEMRYDVQDIKEQVHKTNGRVTSLEHDKWTQRGIVLAITVVASSIWEFFVRGKN
jgi:uncharacterized protein YoxC